MIAAEMLTITIPELMFHSTCRCSTGIRVNIKVAEQQFQQMQLQVKQTEFTIKEEVVRGYTKWQNSLKQKNLIAPNYEQSLQDISQSATERI